MHPLLQTRLLCRMQRLQWRCTFHCKLTAVLAVKVHAPPPPNKAFVPHATAAVTLYFSVQTHCCPCCHAICIHCCPCLSTIRTHCNACSCLLLSISLDKMGQTWSHTRPAPLRSFNLIAIAYMLPMSLGSACSTCIANSLGAGDGVTAQRFCTAGFVMSVASQVRCSLAYTKDSF